MLLATYASLRSRLPLSAFSATSTTGGTIPAGTYNIRIQGRSRAGRNLLSDPIAVTCGANSKILVTLNAGVRQTGEDLFKVSISYETTGNSSDARLLAEWNAKESDQVTLKGLPATVEITQLAPTGELTYLAATTDDKGCDKEITDLANNTVIAPPPYPGGNVRGTPIAMWLSNGLTEDGGADEVQGSTIFLQVAVNGSTIDESGNPWGLRLKDKLLVRIEGMVRRSTGILDTSITGVGESLWDGLSPISIPVPVPRGYAIAVSLILKFSSIALPQGAGFSVVPESRPPYGRASGVDFGDFVSGAGDRALIVPERGGAWRRLSGVVTVSGYTSPAFGEAIFTGLLPDTANQKLAINAQMGGEMSVRAGAVESMEAVRAIASTNGGTYRAIATGTVNLTAIGSIQVAVDYPCDSSGRGTVRVDYPDPIAGNNKGAFNPPRLKVWVEFGGGIFELPDLISVTPAPTQSFLIDTLAGATQVGSIPSGAAANFCLFDYGAIAGSAVAGVGQLAIGSYKVWVAYHFPANNREITSLSHTAEGCLKEFSTGGSSNALTLNNQAGSYYLSRANHTGSQAISTIATLQATLDTIQTNINTLTTLKQEASAILSALVALTTNGLVRKIGADTLTTITVTTDGANLIGTTLDGQKALLGISSGSGSTSSNASTLNNQAGSYYLDRVNHTGSQAISTVTGLQLALDNKQASSATLTAFSGLTGTGLVNKLSNGLGIVAISNFSQTFLGLADAAAARTNLQLGNAAMQDAGAFEVAGAAASAIATHEANILHPTSAAQIGGMLGSNNLGDLANVATARTNLGLGTAAIQNATDFDAAGAASTAITSHEATHTHATSASQIGGLLGVNNLNDLTDPIAARTNLGLGTAAVQSTTAFDAAGAATSAITSHVATYHTGGGGGTGDLLSTNNLSDLANVATARTNLGLGTAATQNIEAFDAAGAATGAVASHEATHTHATSASQIGGLLAASNLADLVDGSAARVNLGLGTAATQNIESFDAAGAATGEIASHIANYTHATSATQIGGLLSANNLSDLTDAATARINLGVDTSQFVPSSHLTTYGNGVHIPTTGISNTHVSTSAAIAFSKLSGVCATPTSGLLSARPAAGATNNGRFYFATDQNGGTLYLGVSGAWAQCGKGVTQT